jgi:hypothetical protein
MENKNSLIALAYLKENDNPLLVFCTYILYSLEVSSAKSLTYNTMCENISSEFGLNLPMQIIRVCIRILKKQNKIKSLPGGNGFKIEDGSFNLKEFNNKRESFREKEICLINKLQKYVLSFNQNWDYDQSKKYLTDFLLTNQNAAKLFTDGSVYNKNNNYISPNYYVGKFITTLLNNDSEITEYLIDIVSGLMIYIGIFQTDDYQQEKERKFKGTNFYIDTKLLLRAMGYSWKLEVESTRKLLNLIVEDYGGNICVFNHTIGEIECALLNASENLKNNKQISDYELRMYAELNNCDEYDFELYKDEVRKKITNDLNYYIQPDLNWNDTNLNKFNIDWEKLSDYISNNHPHWKKRAIENDVNSINYINILRKGNYTAKFGGKKKLPVFITSNIFLVNDIKQYIINNMDKDSMGNDRGTSNWSTNRLPIVSDSMIMCRLWLPKAKSLLSIPTLTLARDAYAAQQADDKFYEKLKFTANDLSKKHNINLIDISEVRRTKLEELIIKNSLGHIDDITPDIVATSVDELVKIETIQSKKELEKKSEENRKNSILIKQQEEDIIKSASLRYPIKFRWKSLIIISKYWLFIITFLSDVFYILLPLIDTNKHVIVIIISIVLYIIGFINSKSKKLSFIQFLQRKSISFVWGRYKNEVTNSLLDHEKKFDKEILQSCINNNSYFNMNSKYCEF